MFRRAKGRETSPKRGVIAYWLFGSLVLLGLPTQAWADEPDAEASPTAARPAPLPPLEPTKLPISRHVDVGAAVAFVQRVTEGQTDSDAARVRYPSAVGVGLSARVDVWRYLRANLYVVRSSTTSDLPAGALGLSGNPGAVPITGYSFGLRLSPTLPLGPRARSWLSFGAGWGRLEMGRFDVADAGKTYQVRERVFSFVEFPLGIGTSFDIIKNWLSIEFEATGAFHAAERGTALRDGQTINTAGKRASVGPFPSLAATFVQTLGLALVL
ncbi:MAG TPA: hypothetical protein PK156_00625 [Polyangium sp.]|nr:hypothetical protein [Polyangium sp.]